MRPELGQSSTTWSRKRPLPHGFRSGERSDMKLSWRRKPKLRYSIDEYAQLVSQFSFNGIGYQTGLTQTLQGDRESIGNDFVSYVNAAYKANGVVFACMMTRRSLFTEAR